MPRPPGATSVFVGGRNPNWRKNVDAAVEAGKRDKAKADQDAVEWLARVKARKAQPPPRWLGKGPEDEA